MDNTSLYILCHSSFIKTHGEWIVVRSVRLLLAMFGVGVFNGNLGLPSHFIVHRCNDDDDLA